MNLWTYELSFAVRGYEEAILERYAGSMGSAPRPAISGSRGFCARELVEWKRNPGGRGAMRRVLEKRRYAEWSG